MDYNVGHPSSQAIAKDVIVHEPSFYSDIPEATSQITINHAEAQHFREYGYIVKRALLENSPVLDKAVEHLWRNVPRQLLRRDDPESWTNEPKNLWTTQDHERVGSLIGTNWKMRSRNGIGTEAFLVDGIANHAAMKQIATEFLGSDPKMVQRVRGIYGVFPKPRHSTESLHPHGDYMAAQLSAMVMVSDVPPRCGGFTVWPGSHLRMHEQWDKVHGSTISGSKVDGYRFTRDRILRDTKPVEFTGSAGDVVFWHPRLIHSAGVNFSASVGTPIVRIIVPCDYQRGGRMYFDDLEFGPGPKYQWWIDTRNFAEDVPSTSTNMWEGWAI